MARGSVVLSQELPVNGDSATVTFAATNQMAPKARLIVYAIRSSNQEILVDAIDFKVNGLFRNDVRSFRIRILTKVIILGEVAIISLSFKWSRVRYRQASGIEPSTI